MFVTESEFIIRPDVECMMWFSQEGWLVMLAWHSLGQIKNTTGRPSVPLGIEPKYHRTQTPIYESN